MEQLTDFDKKILRYIQLNPSDKIHDPHDKIRYEYDEDEEFAWWKKLERLGLIEATGSYKWRCIVDHYGDFIFDTEKYIAKLEEDKDRAERALLRAGYTHLEGAQEWRPPLGPNPCHLLDRIAELEAEVERLKVDADRYNWLKTQSDQGEYFIMSGYVGTRGECGHTHVYDDLADEWIDEAMKGGA